MKKLTGFGMAMTALLSLFVIAVIAGLGWFGFKFVTDTLVGGDEDQLEEDEAIFQQNLAGCIDFARKLKGTGMSYRRFTGVAPKCALLVTPKIWGEL